jgi:hypothetical protein
VDKCISSLMTNQIQELTYLKVTKEDDRSDTLEWFPLTRNHQNYLRGFIQWLNYEALPKLNTKEATPEQYLSLSGEDFDTYWTLIHNHLLKSDAPTNYNTGSPSIHIAAMMTPSLTIKKPSTSVKPDAYTYPTLKDKRLFDQWNASFISQAAVNDLTEVLNFEYKPTSQEEKLSFLRKQCFVCNVFS